MFKGRRFISLVMDWRIAPILILTMILTITGVSCTRSLPVSGDPRSRLKDYIAQSFSVTRPQDRAGLMNFLSGDVKARLQSWSDEQFREAFLDSKKEFIKLSFREMKSISAQEVQITYELTYMDPGRRRESKSHAAKVTQKKLCQMTQENGQWYISDVRSIKELLEYTDELTLP